MTDACPRNGASGHPDEANRLSPMLNVPSSLGVSILAATVFAFTSCSRDEPRSLPCVLKTDLFSVEGTISADDVSIRDDVSACRYEWPTGSATLLRREFSNSTTAREFFVRDAERFPDLTVIDNVTFGADVDGAVIAVTVTDNYVWSMDTTNDLDVASVIELVQQASHHAPAIPIPGHSTG